MSNTKAYIDFGNNTLSIFDDLVIEHLVPEKLPGNIIRVGSNCTILPSSEATIPVVNDGSPDGHFLLQPLPFLCRKNITLAHAIVSLTNQKTHCRIMNPTNAPALLTKNTALVTLSPIIDKHVFTYDKTQPSPTSTTVDYDTQLKTLNDLGITVDATDYTQTQREKLVSLLYSNRDLFTTDICQLPGTDLVKHHIDTGQASPVRQRPYRHSPEARKELDRQIDRMVEADIIEESDSPWGSPVVLVKKRNNTHRLCVDMRKVNSVTKPIFFPLSLLEDVFQTVTEKSPTTYSVCDLNSGFWQIKLNEASKPKTAFVTHRGNYQFKRMPFGIQGAPASYQSLMSKVLRNVLFSYALCYVDDILCMSSSPERHCEHLAKIFSRFRQAKLRLNPSKCKFALSEVVYLGHVLSKDGISVDDSKITLIKTHPTPKNAQQLRSFLGQRIIIAALSSTSLLRLHTSATY